MARCFYGLAKQKHLRDIVIAVCETLGYGGLGGYAVDLMLETAAQETHCGQFRDPTPLGAGRGLFQMDLIAFDDIRNRARASDIRMVIDNFGIDIRKCNHAQLDHSPLLAAIFCRLFYKLIPAAIPGDLVGRAEYWKKYYNTAVGDGSVGEYVNNARLYASVC